MSTATHFPTDVSLEPTLRGEAKANGYPTSDGRPMAETDLHRDLMTELIATLKRYFEQQTVYVSGNLLLFYEPGNKRKHVAPDVLVTKGQAMEPRENYLVWESGPPQVVIELTSRTTSREDLHDKMALYRDVIRVREYFLFDPRSEYLSPPLRGYRLVDDSYEPIVLVNGRLPSEELALHFERDGTVLRLWNPATAQRLPTTVELTTQTNHLQQNLDAEVMRREAAEAELANLKRQLEQLRGSP